MTTKQLGFNILSTKAAKHFGGAYLKNSNAKTARPISLKRSMHLVLRSSKATGSHSFLKNNAAVFEIVNKQAKLFGVKVYRYANGGNHLHMVVLPRSRKAFHGFIRSVSGLVARLILGTQRGLSKKTTPHTNLSKKLNKANGPFWDKRPFTRIIEWGKEFVTVSRYLLQNTLEAYGFISYQKRKGKSANIYLS